MVQLREGIDLIVAQNTILFNSIKTVEKFMLIKVKIYNNQNRPRSKQSTLKSQVINYSINKLYCIN